MMTPTAETGATAKPKGYMNDRTTIKAELRDMLCSLSESEAKNLAEGLSVYVYFDGELTLHFLELGGKKEQMLVDEVIQDVAMELKYKLRRFRCNSMLEGQIYALEIKIPPNDSYKEFEDNPETADVITEAVAAPPKAKAKAAGAR